MNRSGKVYLVGAGPGDPALITVRGLELLRQADAVVYDALAPRSLLEEAPAGAETVDVGKRGGRHTREQDEINTLLVALARQGKQVVRLKGGDPFVFGRGVEEALALAEADVAFEIVPGVTAAVAAAGCAGIPLTRRGTSSSVCFVTGHEDPTKRVTHVHWDRVAHAAQTIVVYMGVAHLREIAEGLRQGGLAASTPAAVVRWGATARQVAVQATLGDIADKASAVESPALLVVGELVSLRGRLRWFEKRPLFGKCILVTRPRGQSRELVARLRGLGAEVLCAPVIRLEPLADFSELDRAIGQLAEFDWIVFTSVNGVRHFFERLDAVGRDARALAGCRVAAIGPVTACALAGRGIRADAVPDAFRSDRIAPTLAALGPLAGSRVLLPRADIAPPDLATALESCGAHCRSVAAYRTVALGSLPDDVLERLADGEVDIVTFTSVSTVRAFLGALGGERHALLDRVCIASIGPVTSCGARDLGLRVAIEAENHTAAGLADAIAAHAGQKVEAWHEPTNA